MKIMLASILLIGCAVAQAQDPGDPGGPGQAMRGQGPRMAHLQQSLGLSQEQVEQIREIRQNGGGRDQVRAVLTDEQRETLDQHRAARQGRGNGDGERPRDGRGRAYGPGYGRGAEPAKGSPTRTAANKSCRSRIRFAFQASARADRPARP